MTEGAFYGPKKASPTTLAVVVLMHGAALTALALAKGEAFTRDRPPPTTVDLIEEQKPPPPVPVDPPKTETPPPPSVITRSPPVVPMPPQPTFTSIEPLPPLPTFVVPQPGPAPVAKADPPAPAPVEKAKTVEPARAKANLASYVSDEDYPANAVRNEEQGTTRFRLAVGTDGRVKECSVTGSSGSSALDATTCKLMKQRAKFSPAKNNRGEPTGDTVTSAIRWVLPAD